MHVVSAGTLNNLIKVARSVVRNRVEYEGKEERTSDNIFMFAFAVFTCFSTQTQVVHHHISVLYCGGGGALNISAILEACMVE